MSQELTGTIQAIASALSAVAALFALFQLRLLRKEIQADHERSRREKAIELLRDWNTSIGRLHPPARNFVEDFDNDECKKVVERTPFYISSDRITAAREALQGIVAEVPLTNDSKKGVLLKQEHLDYLGRNCTEFLNHLEVILEAWNNHIGDRTILENQLSYLVKPAAGKRGFRALETFRLAMGGSGAYPATHAFVTHISAKRTAPAPGKPPTGVFTRIWPWGRGDA